MMMNLDFVASGNVTASLGENKVASNTYSAHVVILVLSCYLSNRIITVSLFVVFLQNM